VKKDFTVMNIISRLLLLTSVLIRCCSAYSLHAEEAITVQVLASRGEYYPALVTFDKLPKRKITVESKIAAARSAWALNLHERAAGLFEQALESPSLTATDKGRIYLSRGIIELQQEHYQMASLLGKKALEHVTEVGPLRAKMLLLIGQAQYHLKNYGETYAVLSDASNQSDGDDEGEVQFLLGESAYSLNRISEAEDHFKAVPYGHERTAETFRKLAELNLQQNKPDKVKFWIEKGQKDFPEQFIDSWTQYALIESSIQLNDIETMRSIRMQANQKYSASDFWLGLINAATEHKEWQLRGAV
jgi:tetratricopeptide (TPR) repeat protein